MFFPLGMDRWEMSLERGCPSRGNYRKIRSYYQNQAVERPYMASYINRQNEKLGRSSRKDLRRNDWLSSNGENITRRDSRANREGPARYSHSRLRPLNMNIRTTRCGDPLWIEIDRNVVKVQRFSMVHSVAIAWIEEEIEILGIMGPKELFNQKRD